MRQKLRIALIDRNSLFRESLRKLLEKAKQVVVEYSEKTLITEDLRNLEMYDIVIYNLDSLKHEDYKTPFEDLISTTVGASESLFKGELFFLVNDRQLGELDDPRLISVYSDPENFVDLIMKDK